MAQSVPLWFTRALLKIVAIVAFMWLTNAGMADRVTLLLDQGRQTSLALFLVVWASAFGSLILVAFHPDIRWRVFWGLLFAGSTFAGYLFLQVSGSQLTLFHAVTLWGAAADTSRAAAFYAREVAIAVAASVMGLVIVMARPPRLVPWMENVLRFAVLLPVVPVVVLAGLILVRIGNDTVAMPHQITPAAIAVASAVRLSSYEMPKKADLQAPPANAPAARHVLILMDESISADTVRLDAQGDVTPYLHSIRHRIADFGTASATSNCSSSSNAIVRLAGGQLDLRMTLKQAPFLWDYARKAGYRTVFIDAGSTHIKAPGVLQNYMTLEEKAKIDEFILLGDGPSPELDLRLADKIAEVLARPEPHLIYANKNGAHFPYSNAYPASQAVFMPAEGASTDGPAQEMRENAYLNAVRWSVDGFFRYFLDKVQLDDTVVIYTADHGQNRKIGALTHCSATDAHALEGQVPLFVMSGEPVLRQRFADAAARNRDRATQFAIVPTVAELLGYDHAQLGEGYGAGLLGITGAPQQFAYGDLFGIFGRPLQWKSIGGDPAPVASSAGLGQ